MSMFCTTTKRGRLQPDGFSSHAVLPWQLDRERVVDNDEGGVTRRAVGCWAVEDRDTMAEETGEKRRWEGCV